MGLRLSAEDVHLVLVEAFVAAELQLLLAVLEVHIVDCVADVFAPVAHLVFLEGGPSALREAEFAAESLLPGCSLQREQLHAHLLAPRAHHVTGRKVGRRLCCLGVAAIGAAGTASSPSGTVVPLVVVRGGVVVRRRGPGGGEPVQIQALRVPTVHFAVAVPTEQLVHRRLGEILDVAVVDGFPLDVDAAALPARGCLVVVHRARSGSYLPPICRANLDSVAWKVRA